MRIAVAGSHGTGKSTLIAAFVDRRPEYVYIETRPSSASHPPQPFHSHSVMLAIAASGVENVSSLVAWGSSLIAFGQYSTHI